MDIGCNYKCIRKDMNKHIKVCHFIALEDIIRSKNKNIILLKNLIKEKDTIIKSNNTEIISLKKKFENIIVTNICATCKKIFKDKNGLQNHCDSKGHLKYY